MAAIDTSTGGQGKVSVLTPRNFEERLIVLRNEINEQPTNLPLLKWQKILLIYGPNPATGHPNGEFRHSPIF